MSTHIDLIFAGLIAFVSNDAFEPSSTIAYVVDDRHHTPVVQFRGKVNLQPAHDSPIECTSEESGNSVAVIDCNLSHVDIIFKPLINEGELFPARPLHNKVSFPGEDRDIGWILRMSNIERGIGKVREDINSLVSSKLTFGWYTAESCELDGQEPESGRRGRPALIGFRAGRAGTTHRQVVAECIMFGARIPEGQVTIRLQSRTSDASRVITADCRESPCLTVRVSNELEQGTDCWDNIVEGAHYASYYELVKNSGSKLIPYSISEKCRNGERFNDTLPPAVVESGLRGIRPLSADLEGAMRRKLGGGQVSFKKIHKTVTGLLRKAKFVNLAGLQGEILDTFKAEAEVMDRVICPPTVLER